MSDVDMSPEEEKLRRLVEQVEVEITDRVALGIMARNMGEDPDGKLLSQYCDQAHKLIVTGLDEQGIVHLILTLIWPAATDKAAEMMAEMEEMEDGQP